MNIRSQLDPQQQRSTFKPTYHMRSTCFHCGKPLTNEAGNVAITHFMRYRHAVTNDVHDVCDPHFDTDQDNAIHDAQWKVDGEWNRDDDVD